MTAARSTGPAMPSGSRSVGGTCTRPSLPLVGSAGGAGIAPVMSLPVIGKAGTCGIATCALSSRLSAGVLLDCRPIGVGEVIDGAAGAGMAGAALLSVGKCTGAGSSIAGIGGTLPVSSSGIAILKVLSTITTTLAPTSSERIFEVMVDASLSPAVVLSVGLMLALSFAFALDA